MLFWLKPLVDRSTGKEAGFFGGPQCYDAELVGISGDGHTALLYTRVNVGERGNPEQLEVWSARSNKLRMILKEKLPPYGINYVAALSPDGRRLAYSSGSYSCNKNGDGNALYERSSKLDVLEIASGTKELELKINESGLSSVAWSPDGQLLAGGDEKGSIWLWDVASALPMLCLKGHVGEVKELLFSPDGFRLISSSNDTTVLVWDLHNLEHPELPKAQSLLSSNLLATLSSMEASKARLACYQLMHTPDITLSLLRKLLLPHVNDSEGAMTLLTQLEDDNFMIRHQAQLQLLNMGKDIEPVLREALKKNLALDVRKSIEKILENINPSSGPSTAEQLQVYRGVEILERIGTRAARQILEELSQLPDGLLQAEEAKAALQRMAKSK